MTEDTEAETRRGPYGKSAARRQQILEKAIEIFARDGVDAGSFRSVAAAIGVSHTALRYYFPTREAFLIAVYEAHEIRDESDDWLGDTAFPVPGLQQSAARNTRVPGLVQLYSTLTADAVGEQHPETHAFIRRRFAVLRAQLAERTTAAQHSGTVRNGLDARDLASLAIAASDGLQTQWLVDPDAVDVEKVLGLLEQLLILADRPAQPTTL